LYLKGQIMKKGIVRFLKTRESGGWFGFLEVEDGQSLYFQQIDGRAVLADEKLPILAPYQPSEAPRIGETILFEPSENLKGKKACPWCLERHWQQAEDQIKNRVFYRLRKQSGAFRGQKTETLWEGWNLREVPHSSEINLQSRYEAGSWYKYWFEKRTEQGWEPCDDPRTTQASKPALRVI
jgi:hypothetical protein